MEKYSVGKRYYQLEIIKILPPRISKNGRYRGQVMVKCDCGNTKIVLNSALTAKENATMSCGCYHKKVVKQGVARKYQNSKHRLYKVWLKMKERCYSKNCISYPDYGARGILVCDLWRTDYESFYRWAIENSYAEGLQIDRIDNDAGYSPNNCRWVTAMKNGNNKRNNVVIDYEGIKDTLSNTLRRLGLSGHYKKVHQRITNYNWTFIEAISNLV